MDVTSVQSSQASSTTSTTKSSTELDKDAFLQILVAQLQNQDPLSPMDSADFMGQLSQLSSVEALQNLSSSFDEFASSNSLVNATALIGKDVVYLDSTGTTAQQGTVDYVQMGDDGVEVYVNGTALGLSDILAVAAGSTSET